MSAKGRKGIRARPTSDATRGREEDENERLARAEKELRESRWPTQDADERSRRAEMARLRAQSLAEQQRERRAKEEHQKRYDEMYGRGRDGHR